MLKLSVSEYEFWDENACEFRYVKPQELVLEHSLVSISKWEAIHKKPFLSNTEKTTEEINDYIRCMSLNDDFDPLVLETLSKTDFDKIQRYIDDPMSAATPSSDGGHSNGVITSETVYSWMISFGIPFECQNWHLNRLLALINACVKKNAPAKKLSQQELFARNTALNAARRKQFNSKG